MDPTQPNPAEPVLTPEEIEAAERLARRSALRRRNRIILVLVLATVIGGAIGARPAWRQVKAWRAAKMASEGEALFAAGQIEGAFGKARAALQIAPVSPAALRLAANATKAAGSPLAISFLHRLVNTPAATLDDRQELARLAMVHDDLRLASNTLATLLIPSNPPVRTLQLAAQHRLLVGDLPAAIRFGRELLRLDGDSPTNLLRLASALSLTREATNREDARLLFLKVAQGPTGSRLAAMEFLVGTDFGTPDDGRIVAALLEAGTNHTTREKVVLADALIRGHPDRRRAALLLLMSSVKYEDPEGVLRVTASLTRHREFNLALSLLGSEHVRTNVSYFRARLSALLEGGFADQAYQAALAPPNDRWFEPFELELVRYRIAARMTNSSLLEEHRERLLSVAGRDARRLRRLVAFAEREGSPDMAAAAAQAWSNVKGESAEALPHLLRAMDRQGDTPGARVIARRLVELAPADPANKLRLAHLDALLGENLEESISVAKPLFESPELGMHARMTAALAYLRRGNPTNAALCLTVKLDRKTALPPSYLAISAAVNGAIGRVPLARLLAGSILLANLRLEEKELVRPYLPPPSPLARPAPAAPAAPAAARPPAASPAP